MGLTWSDTLSVGVPELDAQHRELVERTNRLLAAIALGQGPSAVLQTLGFLEDYVREHFADEEALLREARWEGHANHKHVHDLFVERLRDLRARAAPTEAFAFEVNRVVCGWLTEHMLGSDMVWAAELERRRRRAHG